MFKLITHTDLDGIGCYVVGKYLLKNDIDVSFCNYNNVDKIALKTLDNQEKYDIIFITDISVSDEVAEKLDTISHKIILLDHHHTAEHLNKYSWCKVKVEDSINGEIEKTCGTRLFYDFIMKDKPSINKSLEEFVEMVRKYDTWLWEEKYNDIKPKQLNDLLKVLGRNRFVKNILEKIYNDDELINMMDEYLLTLRQEEIDMYIKSKSKSMITLKFLEYNIGVVMADNYISELGNRLSEMNPNVDFIMIINQESISYRTVKDNVDVGKIAKQFGGGGHRKASGNPMNTEWIVKLVRDMEVGSKDGV